MDKATVKTIHAEKKFRSITKQIAEELRDGILSGNLAPGEKLSEEKLATSLNVSRIPLRDALRRLETQGYVTFLSHSEVIISMPTIDEVEDYYSIAGVLEGLAGRLAVERATAEEVSRLRELHQLLKQAYKSKDLRRYFDVNGRFHGFIAEMARNERLRRLIIQMRQGIQKTRILSLQLPRRLDYSMREHDQILDAFLKRNSDLAEALLLKHLGNQMQAVRQMLQPEED